MGGSGGSTGSGGASGDAGIAGSGGSSGSGGVCDGPCPVAEDCQNGIDDDGDNAVDCSDDDCLAATECSGICTTTQILTCGTSLVSESTAGPGSTNRIGPPPYSCLSGSYAGPERAYKIEADPGQYVFVEAYAFDVDGALFLTDVVDGAVCHADFACAQGSDQSGMFAEMVSFQSESGRDYYVIVDAAEAASYSLTVRCSPLFGCEPAGAISPGQSIDATLAVGAPHVTQMFGSYSCEGTVHTGPEVAYMFTAPTSGTYRVDLTNLTGNLSLIVVTGGCGTTCANSTSSSVSPINDPESVTFAAMAGDTYYFVIDSFNITPTNYTLSLTAL